MTPIRIINSANMNSKNIVNNVSIFNDSVAMNNTSIGLSFGPDSYNFMVTALGLCVNRATSHTRLKAHDHCNLRDLIGRKGGDRRSSLHTRR